MSRKNFIQRLSPVCFWDIDKEKFDPDLYAAHIISQALWALESSRRELDGKGTVEEGDGQGPVASAKDPRSPAGRR